MTLRPILKIRKESSRVLIVCLCRAVSDHRVRSLAAGGARTVADIQETCGAGTGCGSCVHRLVAILRESASEKTRDQGAPPVGCQAHLAILSESTR